MTEIFKLAGDTSRVLAEMHYRIAILRSKVRPETFINIINAIPLPNTDITVIQRAESERGLNVDEERIQDHMPRPAKIDGTDKPTKLLGALVHWVMLNNLLMVLNSYTRQQAHEDFDVSLTVFKGVISGVWQHGGSYYKRLEQEKEYGDEDDTAPKRKCKMPYPVDVALA